MGALLVDMVASFAVGLWDYWRGRYPKHCAQRQLPTVFGCGGGSGLFGAAVAGQLVARLASRTAGNWPDTGPKARATGCLSAVTLLTAAFENGSFKLAGCELD
jgi:hypothetical protein